LIQGHNCKIAILVKKTAPFKKQLFITLFLGNRFSVKADANQPNREKTGEAHRGMKKKEDWELTQKKRRKRERQK
jgi:hypothetical protein